MKIPDAFLFDVETTARDATTLDITIHEGRPVVFCKNCKHYNKSICDKWNGKTGPGGFCHYGEDKCEE